MTVWPPASRTRHSRSPTNAPRALPTVSGPVGLADTNSTLTDARPTGGDAAPAPGSARIAAIVRFEGRSVRRRFRNPGGATSTEAIGESRRVGRRRGDSPARRRAIASGAIRYGRASFIARLLAKSPWSGSAGRSTSTAGASASGAGPAGRRSHRPIPGARDRARTSAGSVAGWRDHQRGRISVALVLLWTRVDGSGPTTAVDRDA